MAKDPAFLFYPSDFLMGVQDLTMEERGQYITLLCLQHQKGHITEKMLRQCHGIISADVLAKFRQDENGNFFNERLSEEIEKRRLSSEKQRQRAVSGWEKRKSKESHGNATAYATAMPLENRDRNENEDGNKDRGLGKEKEPSEKIKFIPPSISEVSDYLVLKYPEIPPDFAQKQAEIFINHYETCSWRYGKQKVPIKDWKRCVPQWSFPEKFKEHQIKNTKHNGKQSFTSQRNELTEELERSKRNLIALSSGDHSVTGTADQQTGT